jgi:multiple sugar transport system ATP-binding protein
MGGGGIRQLGTPEDIYLRPAHVDIARLFGDPTINLLDVDPKIREADGVTITLSDVTIPLPGVDPSAAGRSCVVGLRPETLRFVDAGAAGAIPVTVEAETPLNEKTVTLVRTLRGREILVSRPGGTPGPAEGAAHIAVDGSKALLFDRSSGIRIGVSPPHAMDGVAA